MVALRKLTGGKVTFVGIGGERMLAEGLRPLFPQAKLARMGLVEIILHIPSLLHCINETVAAIKQLNPTALITIDSPDFCFRVARRVQGQGIPLIHYVAPTVWAWRPRRAKAIAKFLDHLLALLPFEPPYFTSEGLPCTFVGHSIVESGAGHGQGERFRQRHEIAENTCVIAVLPGSRAGEVRRLLPIFQRTIERLRRDIPNLHVVIPTSERNGDLARYIRRETRTWKVPLTITSNDADKYDAFNAASVALACSGTVSIELAMARLPMVIAYRVNPVTAVIFRWLTRCKYATLANIMLDRMAVPELLQGNCTPRRLSIAALQLIKNPSMRQEQVQALANVAGWLGVSNSVPSEKAAGVVLEIVRTYRPQDMQALTMATLMRTVE